MFKTSEECQLELVAHTQAIHYPEHDGATGYFYTDDFMPARAARASFGKQDKTGQDPSADKKLMKFLADNKHMTPFEYQHATFLIECPLFIRSQIHRHRTFSYNEISRRYTSENLEFWMPTAWRKQAEKNKQASTNEEIKVFGKSWIYEHDEDEFKANDTISGAYDYKLGGMLTLYNEMIEAGVCREQARAVLPQSLLTRFYMGGNLRNWAHFIELRRDEHAQQEVRIIAERIAKHLQNLWPESCSALGI